MSEAGSLSAVIGYSIVIAEDAASSRSTEMHRFAIENILPRIARIAKTAEIGIES